MEVVITLTFKNVLEYEGWLCSQAQRARLQREGDADAPEEKPDSASAPEDEATPSGATQTEAASEPDKKPAKKRGRPRKPRATKEVATTVIPAKPATEQAALPTASLPAEAAPTDGERTYTLADSREVLTAYLAKEGNGAESLLKELKVHKAKRINEVPSEHVHGFLKRMVEAS